MPHYEPVIGLEVHAQLLTSSKLFCGCSTRFGAAPNTHTCPVCLGLPGALPVLNGRAVELAIRAALSLGCTIHPLSIFARKNYFYPDLPKGYQISQFDRPLATDGALEFVADGAVRRVGIARVHMEEDAGKSLHDGFPDADRVTCVDYNRGGMPLIEIVSHPDLRSAGEAAECFSRLRDILVAVGANDGNMEEGSLRCDANVSVRPLGETTLGVKVEIKNVNSFRYVQRAIEFEIARQVAALEAGGVVVQESRLWDTPSGRTVTMRTKEEAEDYRYFPEPDLPPLRVDAAWVDVIRRGLPELPEARRERLARQYAVPEYDAGVLGQSAALTAYFEATVAESRNAKAASNWIMGDVLRKLKETGRAIGDAGVSPVALGGLIRLVDSGAIGSPVAKQVFEKMYGSGRTAAAIVEEEGLERIDDQAALETTVQEVLAAHAPVVDQYRAGKRQAFGFLVGQIMKATRGQANPEIVNAIVRRLLEQP